MSDGIETLFLGGSYSGQIRRIPEKVRHIQVQQLPPGFKGRNEPGYPGEPFRMFSSLPIETYLVEVLQGVESQFRYARLSSIKTDDAIVELFRLAGRESK